MTQQSIQQYLIIAYDGQDSEALNRRLAVREAHLENIRKLKASGNFIEGGAILSEEGKMIGSSLIMAFQSKEELERWLATDPYSSGNVWQQVDVKPFRCAVL